jgi:hypothetical protein
MLIRQTAYSKDEEEEDGRRLMGDPSDQLTAV